MDLQGVGAIAAAAVTALGIPSALIIGRWQMRGALRTAEETARAGIAQAEASYEAALDAVHATAFAAHKQWRRAIQREAYATFLLAAHQTREAGERSTEEAGEATTDEAFASLRSELSSSFRSLKEAQTIIELEGPDAVAAPAASMVIELGKLVPIYGRQAEFSRAHAKLLRAMDHPEEQVVSAAHAVLGALTRLSHTFEASPLRSRNMTGEQRDQERRDANRTLESSAPALARTGLTDDDLYLLQAGHSPRPPAVSDQYGDAVHRLEEAEVRFVIAAKTELRTALSTDDGA
ncbi:hypothetical protein [Streptomyces sp. NPDC021622]|uniref:hypothetical protein n=1 Tax=Streptomyces sp. NPDC021622 TaxID=3155013 RepID=UPI003409B7AB